MKITCLPKSGSILRTANSSANLGMMKKSVTTETGCCAAPTCEASMKYKSSRGFTLIELLIVIVVLSLLTVIATRTVSARHVVVMPRQYCWNLRS